jgi:hypothetical protein
MLKKYGHLIIVAGTFIALGAVVGGCILRSTVLAAKAAKAAEMEERWVEFLRSHYSTK